MFLQQDVHKRAMIVAPHADDEVLGAGGLIARLTAMRWHVEVLFVTVSGYSSVARGDTSKTVARRAEAEAALAALGVSDYRVLFEGEDNHLRLDTVPRADIIGFIESGIVDTKPSLAVVPCVGHYHQDHQATSQACIAALRPQPAGNLTFVDTVLAYGHTGAGWGGAQFEFNPNTFINITETIEQKLESLACYKSQICNPPHARSLEAIRTWHAGLGTYAGVAYAEAFECLRLTT